VRSQPLVTGALFALLLAAYLLAYSGEVQSSDELSMFCVTRSLATQITSNTDAIRWMGLQQGAYGPDGHLYAKYGLGTSLIATPLYIASQTLALGAVQMTWLLNAVLTALTGVLVFLSARSLGYRDGVALVTGLLYGLCTPAAVYSQSFFSEPLAAGGLLAAGYFLLQFHHRRRAVVAVAAGTALGLALLARISNLIVVPILGLYLLTQCGPPHLAGRSERGEDTPGRWWRWLVRAWGPGLAFVVPLVLGALVVAGYNWLRYGHPFQTGYHPLETFSTPFLTGLVGLLFSPGKGLFLYAPVLVLAVVACPTFFRRHRAEALMVGGVLAAHLLLYSPWFVWHGGHCWGPRFLVPTLPFLALALAPAVAWAAWSRWGLALLSALALLSGTVQALGLAVSFDRFFETMDSLGFPLYDQRLFFDPVYSPLIWQVRFLLAGDWLPAWTRQSEALLPPLALLVLAGGTLLLAWRGIGPRWRVLLRLLGPALAVTSLAAPLALVAALYPDPRSPRPAYRELTHMLDRLARPGDAVILNAPARTATLLEYLRAPLPVLGLHEPGAPSPEAEVALRSYAATHPRLWLVSDETISSAAGLDDWLSARGYKSLSTRFEPAGLALYVFPAELPLPRALGITLGERITLVAVRAAGSAVPGEVVPVAITWRPAAAWHTPEQLHLLVQLFGPDGMLLAQQDWTLTQEEETTTRLGLLLPAPAASGVYRLEARVYRPQDGQRLTTSAGQEAIYLGDVLIAGP